MHVIPIRCPSTIFDCLCLASSWNISPNCRRSTPKIRFFLRFGISTTLYLQYDSNSDILSSVNPLLLAETGFTPTVVQVKLR